jgi:hypothetical protein
MDDTTASTETDFNRDGVIKEGHSDGLDDVKEQDEQENESARFWSPRSVCRGVRRCMYRL